MSLELVHIVYVTIKVGVAKHHGHAPYYSVSTKHFQKLATMHTHKPKRVG